MAADLSHATFLYRARQERDFPIPDSPNVRIGFDRSNDIPIPFEGISRTHARLSFDGKSYWVEDAGSSNGTFLNGRRVTKKLRIDHLDVVTLGRKTDLIFVRKQVKAAQAKQRGIRAAWLEPLDGAEIGSRREIPRGSITLGRSPASNLVVESNLVSKMHARVDRSGVQLCLTDLQSANGTFVNGVRVDSRVLTDGDEISLGGSRTYRVHIEEGQIEVRDTSTPSLATPDSKLPTEWKTRIEWSPEEKAAFDEVLKATRPAPKLKPAASTKAAAVKATAAPAPSAPTAPAPAKPAAAVPPPTPPASAATPAPPPAAPSARPPSVPAQAAMSAAHAARPAAEQPQSPAGTDASSAKPTTRPQASAPSATPAGATIPIDSAAALPRVLLEGPQQFILPAGSHEVGRLPSSKIRIDSPEISRRHALVWIGPSEVLIEDLGSANGTFINGKQTTGRHPVVNGDLVQFGSLTFRIRMV